MQHTVPCVDTMTGKPSPKELASLTKRMTPILRILEQFYMKNPGCPTMKFDTLSGVRVTITPPVRAKE